MSRTLGQLDVCTPVMLMENGEAVKYWLLDKKPTGGLLLRDVGWMAHGINPTNVAVYENSEADLLLNNEETGFLSRFDAATRMAITACSRPTFDYGDTECRFISRGAFLLTCGEMYLNTPTALEPFVGLAIRLAMAKGVTDFNAARICRDVGGVVVDSWLASAASATAMWRVLNNGNASTNGAASNTNWLRPALNVALDTIVSDEGADVIYLLPDKSYRDLGFSAKVAESTIRPREASVEYDTSGLYDVIVEVCNNYGDAPESRVWVPCSSGATVTLANDVKQTENWQLGVRVAAKSQGYGYINEPVVKWR